MLEFVGLRSKMYAYRVEDFNRDKFVKKSKGCTKSSIKTITFDHYKKSLFDSHVFEKTQKLIKSKKHEVFSVKQQKIVFSPYDDKGMLKFSETDTKPWGYIS